MAPPWPFCLFAEQSAGRKNNCQLLCSDYFRTLFSVIWDSAEAISEAAGIFDGDIHVGRDVFDGGAIWIK